MANDHFACVKLKCASNLSAQIASQGYPNWIQRAGFMSVKVTNPIYPHVLLKTREGMKMKIGSSNRMEEGREGGD